MLLHSLPDRNCDPPLKASLNRNAGTIRPAPGRSALLLIGVAIPVYNHDRSRFNGMLAPLPEVHSGVRVTVPANQGAGTDRL